ncbi:MAG: HU family DNA-binding protein, partial [Sulfuricurvum sp.]
MTKKELIALIAESTEETQKSVDGFLNAFTEIVGEELKAG